VECLGCVNSLEESLARSDPPRLVSNVNEDIIPPIEGTERQPTTDSRDLLDRCQRLSGLVSNKKLGYQNLLSYENGLFEGFATESVAWIWYDSNSSTENVSVLSTLLVPWLNYLSFLKICPSRRRFLSESFRASSARSNSSVISDSCHIFISSRSHSSRGTNLSLSGEAVENLNR
jgi:hypothetical protein